MVTVFTHLAAAMAGAVISGFIARLTLNRRFMEMRRLTDSLRHHYQQHGVDDDI